MSFQKPILFLLLILSPTTVFSEEFTGSGDLIDFSVTMNGTDLKAYIADLKSNRPLTVTSAELQLGDESAVLKETSSGIYHGSANFDIHDAQLVVYVGEEADVIDLETTNAHQHENGHDHSHADMWWIMAGISALLFILGFLGGKYITKKPPSAEREVSPYPTEAVEEKSKATGTGTLITLVVAFLAAATSPQQMIAHEGHSHAEMPDKVGDGGGTVEISKKSQFLIGVETQEAVKSTDPTLVKTMGHIIPIPQKSSKVMAPRSGFVAKSFVSLGQNVKKGARLAELNVVGTITVRAPISGTVVEMGSVSGSRFERGQVLYHIVESDRVWVDAEVFQDDLSRLSGADTALVSIGNGSEPYEAKVIQTKSIVNEETLTAKIFLEMDNSAGQVFIGQLVEVGFALPGKERHGFIFPESAVVHQGGEPIVYLKVGPQKFVPKPVRALPGSRMNTIIITDGIEESDLVVTRGNYQILIGTN